MVDTQKQPTPRPLTEAEQQAHQEISGQTFTDTLQLERAREELLKSQKEGHSL